MRVLFTAVGGHGHLQPLLPLAEAARRAGHDVLVTAAASLGAHVSGRGLPFEASRPDLTPVHSDLVLRTLDDERDVLRTHFAGDLAHLRATDVLTLIRRWDPDVVVRDEVDFGAAAAAEVSGRPQAVVVVLPAGGFLTPEVVREPLDRLRARFGLARDTSAAMPAGDVVLAPFPASFRDAAHPLDARTVHYRPAAESGLGAEDRGSGVYVTLGTIFNTESGDLLVRLVRGAAEIADRVIVATGPTVDPESLGLWPPHVTVLRFVDQPVVLTSCAAVVSHAGSGTVLDALRLGVPQVCVPLGADQPLNARRCEDLGIGLSLDAHDVDAATVASAVTTVLTDRSYGDAARRLHDASDALPGVGIAVAALEAAAAARGRPTAAAKDV